MTTRGTGALRIILVLNKFSSLYSDIYIPKYYDHEERDACCDLWA